MPPPHIKLHNVDGSFRCKITEFEAKRGIRLKNIRRVSPSNKPPIYQLIQQADPSESRSSQCEIAERDMRIVCGLQGLGKKGEEQEQIKERLIGHGLISESDRFRRGYRVLQATA
jgi:hypothetical protein